MVRVRGLAGEAPRVRSPHGGVFPAPASRISRGSVRARLRGSPRRRWQTYGRLNAKPDAIRGCPLNLSFPIPKLECHLVEFMSGFESTLVDSMSGFGTYLVDFMSGFSRKGPWAGSQVIASRSHFRLTFGADARSGKDMYQRYLLNKALAYMKR